MIVLLVMTDGRAECLERTIDSARLNLRGPITRAVMHDDSADADFAAWLDDRYPEFEHVHTGHRSGFGGAIRSAWHFLMRTAEADACRYVFHLEDDFTFRRPVDLSLLSAVLGARPSLAQLALRRQPWNEDERAAGGIVEQHPEAYEEHRHGDLEWLEHRLFFTTNPSLYRRSLTWRGWPDGAHSEGRFGWELFQDDPEARAGFWGALDSGEWVEHIGTTRAGTGY